MNIINRKLISCVCFCLFLYPIVFAQQTERIYLSGQGADDVVYWDFYCSSGMNSGRWSKIAVPSCWEQQGFGEYNYGHDKFDNRLNETGLYRYNFKVPKIWKDKEISIVFDGVMTDAMVKINGQLAGEVHQGAFYQFRYDISTLVTPGKQNQLEVFVKKHSDNPSVNQTERKADFWVLGGIFRPVFLEAKPKININRVAIDAKADGRFISDVYLANWQLASTLKIKIQTLAGEGKGIIVKDTLSAKTRVKGEFNSIDPWTPEKPVLYKAVFSLYNKKDELIHQYTERIGFRTVEVKENDGIYVNGVRIKMKGVNRHTFHPKYGRTSSKRLSIDAVRLMKEMNMNAARMSHYPPDKHFLDVCDSLGLFVLDELTAWQKPSYDDIVGRKLLEEMIAHDVNHPSIIMWDNGNEGGENNSLNDDFAELDIQKRIVIHPWQDYEKTNTNHYIDYSYLSHDGFSRRKIFYPTEFLHGLYDGGGGAGLEDYWKLMYADPLCAGGFLWVFADEAIERTDQNNELDTDGNHAPDGILGPYLEKEGSFWTVRDVWSPIQFEKKYITREFDGRLVVKNRYLYTNLNEVLFNVKWISYTDSVRSHTEIIKIAKDIRLTLAPGEKGNLELPLEGNWQEADLLQISAKDARGRIINQWTWPVKRANESYKESLAPFKSKKPVVVENETQWLVTSGDVRFSISKDSGKLEEVTKNGEKVLLSNGPVFVSRTHSVRNVQQEWEGDSCRINVSFQNGDHFEWIIGREGVLELEVAYEPIDDSPFAGITFNYPEEDITGMRWMGDGPYRVYKNRMRGVKFGIWTKAYNNTVTGESGWEYPEFKGYHANVYWAEINGKENISFKVFIQSDDIFLRMLTPESPGFPAKTTLDYPSGDLSFLQGINAIGTKF